MEIEARFAERVRSERLARGWSQEELAHRADMHRTFVSQIERAVKTSTIRTVGKIAKAFDVKPGSLID